MNKWLHRNGFSLISPVFITCPSILSKQKMPHHSDRAASTGE
jgi:hypothetical protein